ncbi:hypothetical protein [Sporosarcina sp. JAI121]|nr:hypothetical protein [Sporosarcina sp. JAI121]NYF23627.1 hypothetical protein [Sporosarcina sp. JAI121]
MSNAEMEQTVENPYTVELHEGTIITLNDGGEVADTEGTDSAELLYR